MVRAASVSDEEGVPLETEAILIGRSAILSVAISAGAYPVIGSVSAAFGRSRGVSVITVVVVALFG
jgi:hypothetical protein